MANKYAKFDLYAPQMIADLVKDFDLTPKQAAGFAGNAGHESAGFTDIIEDGAIAKGMAGGTGWFQWTGLKKGQRRAEFEAWLKRKGWKADSYEGNYSFLFRELLTTEKAALARVRNTTRLDEAAEVVWKYFERPEDSQASSRNYGKSLQARKNWALRALQQYEATKPSPTVWPGEKVKIEATAKEKEMNALLANPLVMELIAKAVASATEKLAQNPLVPEVTQQNATVVQAELERAVTKTPEFRHATNTEMHWWQQRSKWSMIFAIGTPIIAATTGYNIDPTIQTEVVTGIIAVGNAIAGWFALRAGQATKPLFSS